MQSKLMYIHFNIYNNFDVHNKKKKGNLILDLNFFQMMILVQTMLNIMMPF